MSWVYLLAAGFFEIGFTTFMKLSNEFTDFFYSTAFTICAICSFWLLSKSLADIPLGTAYAVWTGIGAFGTAIIGMVFFDDPVSSMRIFLLGVLVASIIGLKLVAAGSA